MDVFEKIAERDELLKLYCKDVEWLLRIGSSLHPEWFKEESDIDYMIVLPVLTEGFVLNFPLRISPELSVSGVKKSDNFFWRIECAPILAHRVTVTCYTTARFLRYVEDRSPPKMYVLHENLLLAGNGAALDDLRDEFPPDSRTARQDRAGLVDPKYHHRFLWAWRSVCVCRENGRWLRNKREIAQWVHEHYPGLLANEKALLVALDGEIAAAEARQSRGL
jgi:hypothetical protein